jgi:uroporphyrinogen decarboxylase
MTGRERFLAAVRRTPADRVPAGFMGWEERVAVGVRRLLGVPPAADPNDLLGIDFFRVGAAYLGPDFAWKRNERKSFFGSSDKTYADDGVVERPLRHAASVREVEAFRWPTVADHDCSVIAGQLAAAGDRAIITGGWTPTFSQLCELFGMETALYNLAAAPELLQAGAERIAELNIGLLRAVHAAAPGKLDVFATADDLATQRGLMFSPATWRQVFKPTLARQFAAGKQLGLITWIHACGDVSAILPDLIEIGLDVLEPTQAHLPGMRPERLKREFGKDLTFFGGISTQTTLPFGTPEDVRREVRERIRVLGSGGGGYVAGPDHTVLDGVPPENVLALYEEVGSLRR